MRNSQNFKQIILAEDEATTFEASVDTQGFRFARISFSSGSSGRLVSGTKIEQSDDDATWSAIPKAVAGVDYSFLTKPNSTTQPKIVWDIPMAGKKRYLKATIVHNTIGRGQLIATLLDPIDGITTAEETGAAHYVLA